MLVLDGGANVDADDLDGQLEVVVDRQVSWGATLKTAFGENVTDDSKSWILGSIVASGNGEGEGHGRVAWELDVRQVAASD